ncbi:bridging integrator 3 isoform X3 [Monodon monoceros]|nr:bridging integrator 3 isoform X3 [Monodon monoceros]XP_029057194.1 bridging integrator 3 isoform X3 [Monodon monoceros]XP_029057195.1 bridging integrator 3 isoform X3 [Monodon monoceros]XP_029057197.1 bridging integrator 3 isoform X3 [Monodon monoceros]
MKKSTDADLAMSKSAVKISLDLLSNPLCEQDQDFLNMVTALDTAMKRMDAFNQEKVNQIQKTVIEPLKKFGSVFPSLNMAVKRREQALQDYRRLQAKVEKYEEKEKTGPVLAKLHQAREELRPVRDDFEAKNKQLLDEMPRFYNSRLDYFQPSFESLIRAQVRPLPPRMMAQHFFPREAVAGFGDPSHASHALLPTPEAGLSHSLPPALPPREECRAPPGCWLEFPFRSLRCSLVNPNFRTRSLVVQEFFAEVLSLHEQQEETRPHLQRLTLMGRSLAWWAQVRDRGHR